MRILIVGAGYVGLPLGEQLANEGHEVYGMRRSQIDSIKGVHPLVGDITDLEGLKKLPTNWDWVVNTISSSKGGADDYRRVYLDGTRNIVEWLSGSGVHNYICTSSTSVYGQTDGSLVNEASPTEPKSETSRILVETEELLLRQRNIPAVILRVAGIYGPGRGHLFQQFLRGEASITGEGSRYLNMIHRDDVVRAIIAALHKAS